MKIIKIVQPDRTMAYNPMYVKRVELIHNKANDNWCVNVVHVVNDREVAEPVICKNQQSAFELHKEYVSCLESI